MFLSMMESQGNFDVAVNSKQEFYWKKRYRGVDFNIENLLLYKEDNIIRIGVRKSISKKY